MAPPTVRCLDTAAPANRQLRSQVSSDHASGGHRRPSAAVGDGVGAAAGAGALHGVGAGARVQVGVGAWGVGARADAPRLQWSARGAELESEWTAPMVPIAVPIAAAGMERWGEDREAVEGVAMVRSV